MLQVSRDKSLKIPKQIIPNIKSINSLDDVLAVKQAIATAENMRFSKKKYLSNIEDQELNNIIKIPANANDLIVITVVKKLGAYVIAITEKSPSKFRGVFVNRMQNYCLDALENLLRANFLRLDSEQNKKLRENYQKEAIINLKMLGYISMVAQNSKCILLRQYKQISLQIGEAINLVSSWKKSDDNRWKNRKK